MAKYTFDMKYWVAATISAENIKEARGILARALNLIEVSEDAIKGFNSELERQGEKPRLEDFTVSEEDEPNRILVAIDDDLV